MGCAFIYIKSQWHIIYTLINGACHWRSESNTAPLVSLTDQVVVPHTFNPSSYISCHRNQAVYAFNPSGLISTFNPNPTEEYKMGGDNSQTQSHSEIPGGRIAISDWGQGMRQWMVVLFFGSSGWTPVSHSEYLLIVLHMSYTYYLLKCTQHNQTTVLHCKNLKLNFYCWHN